MRKKVILYNPDCVFHTMPLALLAVGSFLDPAEWEVVIIDARLEADPHARVLAEAADATCLGISVLTGTPLRDALALARRVKARHADLPIVWGGWHPSLFPTETLADPSVDITVSGQGKPRSSSWWSIWPATNRSRAFKVSASVTATRCARIRRVPSRT